MKIYRLNILMILLLFLSATGFSQIKKLDKSYNTGNDVKVNIDTRHTKVIVEHWDKNQVHIEAFLDSKDLPAAEAKKLLDIWKMETSLSNGEVTIISGGGNSWGKDVEIAGLSESLGHLQDLIAPIMSEMVAPMMKSLAENPPLPPDFAAKMGNLNFDYEAYQKDGEKYMQKWEKQVEKSFGKDFEDSMEKWASQFEKNAEAWEKNFEKEMEFNEENFEKSMEKWAESFGAQMETLGKEMEKKAEATGKNSAARKEHTSPRNSSRTLRIKVPENAKLNIEVRHGEVNLGQRAKNLKANLSHSKLSANIIEGKDTEVKASYSPIKVVEWKYGILNTSYVQDAVIDKAKSIKLLSNSSNVTIKEITETGILSGSFGELKIGKLSPNFQNLDITLKNSDLALVLPDTALNFNYAGSQSEIQYPKTSTIKSTKSYDNEMINGFYKSGSGKGNVSIKASFSDIYIK